MSDHKRKGKSHLIHLIARALRQDSNCVEELREWCRRIYEKAAPGLGVYVKNYFDGVRKTTAIL